MYKPLIKYTSLINPLIEIAKKAGEIILGYYEGKIDFEVKNDQSPVTKADIEANNYIVEQLKALTPDIIAISEEGEHENISNSDRFWLVDPLDGTKSFINHTGEFTVNIGLVEKAEIGWMPVLGVVNVPARDEIYYTGGDGHAYRLAIKDNLAELISVAKPAREGLVVVASHSHRSKETDEYIAKLKVRKITSAGSSLKFCMIASGKADVYPRFGKTMEWDTAAGHAVLLAAGGHMRQADGGVFAYGKKDFLNPNFIAWSFLS